MPRTSTPKSPSERYARLVAKAFAKGRAPSQTQGLQDFIFRNDAAVFETLEGIVAHLASARDNDAALTQGYLYLLQAQLENLRFQRDRGYDLAIGMIENFQRAVANHARTRRLQGGRLALVISTLHQAGIPASADLTAAMEETNELAAIAPGPGELAGVIDAIVEAGEGDAFLIVDSLAEKFEPWHVCGIPCRHGGGAGDIAERHGARRQQSFMLLDPERQVRDAVLTALKNSADFDLSDLGAAADRDAELAPRGRARRNR